jgi:malonyl-CoA O-methyltransferase
MMRQLSANWFCIMFDRRDIQQDFSGAAAQYDQYAVLQHNTLLRLWEKAEPLLPAKARLLDAGCGTGKLARLVPEHDITQLDVAFAMCFKAAELGPAANGTVDALPFKDAAFDGVVCSLVLQWVPHWREALAEMGRVLKPGGVLAVSTFGSDSLKELKESFAAVDRYSHVSSFLPRAAFDQSEIVTEYYTDLLSLMRHLKRIGARNKLLGRRRSVMSRGQFERLQRRYTDRFSTPDGLAVTWEILSTVTCMP